MGFQHVIVSNPPLEVSLNINEFVFGFAFIELLKGILHLGKDITVKAGTGTALVMLDDVCKLSMNFAKRENLLVNALVHGDLSIFLTR
jgi:hypothetical protein